MKKQTYNSLGLDFQIDVPATIPEFDKLAKHDGACLTKAVDHVVNTSVFAQFRQLFLHGREASNGQPAFKGLEALTGIPRKVKVGSKKKNDYAEGQMEYFERLCKEKNVAPASFQSQATATAALVKFDPSERSRGSARPPIIATRYKEQAAAILRGPNLHKFQADLKKQLGVEWVAPGKDEAANIESLAYQCRELALLKERGVFAAYM